ncbi:MAG: respiratory nitrate reductase subunit gamma [Solirubrobacteraceae bacterium]
MSLVHVLLWVILPYAAATCFVVGHWWRYRTDQFAWTSRSTQLLDRRILGWASPMFHYGALAAIGGHVIGLCIPPSVTAAIGISEGFYRWFAGIAGGIAALVTLIGFLGLLFRRASSDRVRVTTSRMDLLTYFFLTFLICLGTYMTFANTLLGGAHPFNYRPTIGAWWRSLFYLHPNVAAAVRAPLAYQLHAIVGWGFWAVFPFGRLVHAWSIPLQYLGRPYIIYRRRYQSARRRYQPLR